MIRVAPERDLTEGEPGGIILNPFLPIEESRVVSNGFSLLQRGNKTSIAASELELIRGQQQEEEMERLVR